MCLGVDLGGGRREARAARAAGVAAGAGILVLLLLIVLLWTGVGTGVFRHAPLAHPPQAQAPARRQPPGSSAVPPTRGSGSFAAPGAPRGDAFRGDLLGVGDGGDSEVLVISDVLQDQDNAPLAEVVMAPTDEPPLADSAAAQSGELNNYCTLT